MFILDFYLVTVRERIVTLSLVTVQRLRRSSSRIMAQATCTLLVRHLPTELDVNKTVDFLKHFGASQVSVMGNHGLMKHSAFASFASPNAAKQALQRLHQLEVCGRRLAVEYAREKHSDHFPHEGDSKMTDKSPKEGDVKAETTLKPKDRALMIRDEIYAKFGITYPRNPGLTYLYPPPTVSTLTNMANALASHPRFYVQVLHLMNKMNLPAPFGPATPTPPVIDDSFQRAEDATMAISSSEESEIGSDAEMKSQRETAPKKRPSKEGRKKSSAKRPKFIPPPLPAPIREPSYVTPLPSDVFDTSDTSAQKRISLHIPSSIEVPPVDSSEDVQVENMESSEVGSFGILEPMKSNEEDDNNESEEEIHIDPSKFVSFADIKRNRVSTSQMRDLSSFKNYTPGQPSSRIYLKNLSRKVTEEDLINLFGRFSSYETEEGRKMFYVQLMEGRMKGQAFVTVASEVRAQEAVREVNGYVMHGKPLVVQFARTAKPKDVAPVKR